MNRVLASLIAPAAIVLCAVVACEDDGKEAACRADTDCATGFTCRGEVCGAVGFDASAGDAGILGDTSTSTCVAEQGSCSLPNDCCSGQCSANVCVRSAGSTTTTPTCRGAYELCQNDCCPSFTCINGSCR